MFQRLIKFFSIIFAQKRNAISSMEKFIRKKVAPYATQQIAIAMMASGLQRLASKSKFFPKSYEIGFAESHIQILLHLKIAQKFRT